MITPSATKPLPENSSQSALLPLPTLRTLVLFLPGAFILAAAMLLPSLVYLFWFYLLCIFALLIVEIRLTMRPEKLKIHRENEAKLSLGADNLIRLIVRYTDIHPLKLSLRDEAPDDFNVNRRFLTATLVPDTESVLQYYARPLHRGRFTFGRTIVRCPGPLGLLIKQYTYNTVAEVHVYPNLLAVRRYDSLVRRQGMNEAGLKQVRRPGTGGEFERLREYRSDDEYRRINWKATARRGIPIAMEFETERSQNILLLLDTGRLMSAPAGELSKLDYAINAALMLAYVATLKGDRVGLLTFADTLQLYVAPGRGRSQFLSLLNALYNVSPTLTEPDYRNAITYLGTKIRRRSLVLIFTDLLDHTTAQTLSAYISTLAPRHLPVLIVLRDTAVVALADASPIDPPSIYRRVVATELLNERQTTLEALHKRGVLTIDVTPDKLTVSLIDRYLELKAKGRI